jgi:hypothetical protein
VAPPAPVMPAGGAPGFAPIPEKPESPPLPSDVGIEVPGAAGVETGVVAFVPVKPESPRLGCAAPGAAKNEGIGVPGAAKVGGGVPGGAVALRVSLACAFSSGVPPINIRAAPMLEPSFMLLSSIPGGFCSLFIFLPSILRSHVVASARLSRGHCSGSHSDS